MSDDASPTPCAPGVTVRESAIPTSSGEPADTVQLSEAEGGSEDYRYIQVRRTLIYIEQSIKNALDQFVFAPNTQATWASAVSAVTGVLQEMWSRGELAGATAREAFSVACGLGRTMTAQDVHDGNLIVQVMLSRVQAAPVVLNVELRLQGGA